MKDRKDVYEKFQKQRERKARGKFAPIKTLVGIAITAAVLGSALFGAHYIGEKRRGEYSPFFPENPKGQSCFIETIADKD